MAARQAELDATADKLDVLGLGPVVVTDLPDVNAVQVTLDGLMRDKAITLQRWLDVVDVRSITCGVRDKHDPELKLHLRGWFDPTGALSIVASDLFPNRQIMIVTAPFHKVNEDAAVAWIEGQIEKQDVESLLRRLVEIEKR